MAERPGKGRGLRVRRSRIENHERRGIVLNYIICTTDTLMDEEEEGGECCVRITRSWYMSILVTRKTPPGHQDRTGDDR